MSRSSEIFRPDGAVKALQEAKEQGIARHIGVTGHADPAVLIEAITRFPFDTLLLAVNAADPHHLSFREQLLPLAVEKEMGIIGMKIPARGRLLARPSRLRRSAQRHSGRAASSRTSARARSG